MSDERVEVWRQQDGTWRWRYVVVEDNRELRSNRGYDSLEEAIISARRAYPEVHVLGTADPATLDGAPRPKAVALRVVMESALMVFALLVTWAALRQARRKRPRRR